MEQHKEAFSGKSTKQILSYAPRDIKFPITETHIRTAAKAAGVQLGVAPRESHATEQRKVLKEVAKAVVILYMQLGIDIPEGLLEITGPLDAKLKPHT
jgi:hypothetical protein